MNGAIIFEQRFIYLTLFRNNKRPLNVIAVTDRGLVIL